LNYSKIEKYFQENSDLSFNTPRITGTSNFF
jgi:hypothetical protein